MTCGGSHLGFPIGIKNRGPDPMGKYSNAFFSETTHMIKAKLYMNVHWMVLYKLYVFCSDMKFKMAATAGLSLTLDPKNTKFVMDLPMIDAQFRFNQCNSFREEYISVFSPYGPVLILNVSTSCFM
jgi:hypothetical protein